MFMSYKEWQSSTEAYWPNRIERLIYAIQHLPGPDEYGRLPVMGWICTIELLGEIYARS